MKRSLYILLIIPLLTGICFAYTFDKVQIKSDENILNLSFILVPEFEDQIINIIDSGNICTNVYVVELIENGPINTLISRNVITKTVKWNNWANRYDVVFNPGTAYQQSYFIKNRTEMLAMLRNNEFVWLCNRHKIDDQKKYIVRIRSEFNSVKLLPPLGWILNTMYNFKTPWIKVIEFEGSTYAL